MNPRDLIDTARHLTDSGLSQPTQAELRRVVSTACYALFHSLAAAAAAAYRAIEHGKTRSACQQQEEMRTFPTAIRDFAETFIDLQKPHQQADYAHDDQYSKLNVRAMRGVAWSLRSRLSAVRPAARGERGQSQPTICMTFGFRDARLLNATCLKAPTGGGRAYFVAAESRRQRLRPALTATARDARGERPEADEHGRARNGGARASARLRPVRGLVE